MAPESTQARSGWGSQAAVPVGGEPKEKPGPGACLRLGRRRAFRGSGDCPGPLTPGGNSRLSQVPELAHLFLGKGQGRELVGRLLGKGPLQDCSWPAPGHSVHEDRLPLQPPAQRYGSWTLALGASPSPDPDLEGVSRRPFPTAHLTA